MRCKICLEYGKQTVEVKDKSGVYEICFECLDDDNKDNNNFIVTIA
jgi:hypothetical protein